MTSRTLLLLILVVLGGCAAEEGGIGGTGSIVMGTTVPVSGAVNKGPFASGAVVEATVLDGQDPVSTETLDRGEFSISLNGGDSYRMQATGVFFDEITGVQSDAEISLSTIIVASEDAAANINVATHLAAGRIRTLIDDGVDADVAITMARDELLLALGRLLPPPSGPIAFGELILINGFESLPQLEGNAWLLALSSTVLVAADNDLQAFVDGIADEFASEGLLSDSTVEALIEASVLLNPDSVHQNLLLVEPELKADAASASGAFTTESISELVCRVFGSSLVCAVGELPAGSLTDVSQSLSGSSADSPAGNVTFELQQVVADMNRFLDTDRDGIPNAIDDDDDNDGISDADDDNPYGI